MKEVKTIITYPNDILRARMPEGEVSKKEIEELSFILNEEKNAAGLAANQIGLKKRFFGIKNSDNGKTEIYVDPEITKFYGEKTFPELIDDKNKREEFLEGCLSFPEIFGAVQRYLKIGVKWKDGETILKGFNAIVFQHELDHLNGIVLVDRVKESSGKLYRISGGKKEEISLPDCLGQFEEFH